MWYIVYIYISSRKSNIFTYSVYNDHIVYSVMFFKQAVLMQNQKLEKLVCNLFVTLQRSDWLGFNIGMRIDVYLYLWKYYLWYQTKRKNSSKYKQLEPAMLEDLHRRLLFKSRSSFSTTFFWLLPSCLKWGEVGSTYIHTHRSDLRVRRRLGKKWSTLWILRLWVCLDVIQNHWKERTDLHTKSQSHVRVVQHTFQTENQCYKQLKPPEALRVTWKHDISDFRNTFSWQWRWVK